MPKGGAHSGNLSFFHAVALFVAASLVAAGCGVNLGDLDWDEDGGNIGWVRITGPTSAGSFTAHETPVTLSGRVFKSPAAGSRTEYSCPCSGWECLLYPPPPSACNTYTYYDEAVTVRVTNRTSGQSVLASVSSGGDANTWEAIVFLADGQNPLEVRADDTEGNQGTDRVVIYFDDPNFVPAPENVTATPGDGQVGLAWDPVAGALSYNVYYGTRGWVSPAYGTVIDVGNVTAFTHTGLVNGTTYSYVVTGVTGVGESGPSAMVSAAPFFDPAMLPSPANVKASSGSERVTLSWDPVAEAESYNVYFGTAPGVTPAGGTLISGIGTAGYTHTGLPAGATYYYVVTTVAGSGESYASAEVQALVGPWAVTFGGAYGDTGAGIAVDASGHSRVTGQTWGDLAGTGNAGVSDFYVARFDGGFSPVWIRQSGTGERDQGSAIALDADGGVYITGTTEGDLAGSVYPGQGDVFVARYGADGTPVWISQFGTVPYDVGTGIGLDGAGNAYVTGWTEGGLGDGYGGGRDLFLARFDAAGDPVWIRQLGSPVEDYATGIAVDAAGNTAITGHTGGDLAGTGHGGAEDVFVARFDAAGTLLWVRQIGTGVGDFGTGIVQDENGYITITGYTGGDLAGTGHAGLDDAFIARFDASGTLLWVRQIGTAGGEAGTGIALDANGNSHVVGYTDGDLAGTGNAGAEDVFIARFTPSGGLLGVSQFGTVRRDFGAGIALDAGGNAYVTGTTGEEIFVTRINAP